MPIEEVRWVSRTEDGTERLEAARTMSAQETDRRGQVWILVRLGGQRRIDTAREYGYQDGSAIIQILRRQEQTAAANPETIANSRNSGRFSKMKCHASRVDPVYKHSKGITTG